MKFEKLANHSGESTHQHALMIEQQANAVSSNTKRSTLVDAERHKVLEEWKAAEREYPQDKCIHQLFEEQVVRTPEAIAVVYENQSLTYRELNQRANQLAHYLRKQGVGQESLVGLFLERSVEMIIAILGTLKAGAAYVPIDPVYPIERISFILEDTKTSVVVTEEAFRLRLTQVSALFIFIDSDWKVVDQENNTTVKSYIAPDNLAYVIYTSGSTGNPKGVLITHNNVVRLMRATSDWFGFNTQDVWTMFHSYAFDFSVWEIWGALANGGKLVVVSYIVSRSPDAFCKLLAREKVTVLNQTPSAFDQIIRVDTCAEGLDRPNLRYIIFGGEALQMQSLRHWFKKYGDTKPKLINMYGITETTVHVTYRPITKEDLYGPSVIGIPIPDLKVYILDYQLQPVAVGMPGEMYICGAGLARGYLNQPKLTEEKFISNPFSDNSRNKLYKSGDLARRLPNGDIEYLGRSDFQVKIRGFRIELGEIEAQLNQQPAISASAVMAEGEGSDKVIVAYLVARAGKQLSASGMRDWLAARLPEYMVPARFVQVAALPININGKLDRQALAQMDGKKLEAGAEYAAPRNELEQQLVTIWESILDQQPIGIHDNFFHLGGHSLLAVALCSQIETKIGKNISIRHIFNYPTIGELANALPAFSQINTAEIFGIKKIAHDQSLCPSAGQLQLWFLDQLEPNSKLYLLTLAIRLKGFLNKDALQRSIEELTRRHGALRMFFQMEDNNPKINIHSDAAVVIEDIILAPNSENREGDALKMLEAFLERPFKIDQSPLFRVALICLNQDDYILALVVHHIVADGRSMEILQADLATIYNQAIHTSVYNDSASTRPQFGDYLYWHKQNIQPSKLEKQLAFWQQKLKGIPHRLELPSDHSRPVIQTHQGASHQQLLDRQLTNELSQLARTQQSTLFLLMLSTFQVLLQRLSGQDDFVIGTPVDGRRLVETQDMVGFFMNSLALRVNLQGNPTFLQVLQSSSTTFIEATENQDVSFQQIVEKLDIERDLTQTPVFQVFINHLSYEHKRPVFEGLHAEPIKRMSHNSKFDLTLYFAEDNGQLKLDFAYDKSLFKHERIVEMGHQLENLLQQVVRNPEERIQALSLVTASARNKLPDPTLPLTKREDKSVLQCILEQTKQNPNRVALEEAYKTWTYQELHDFSEQIANNLISRGWEHGAIVAIYANKCANLVGTMLGIWKAGGAFCILDANYPAAYLLERLLQLQPRALISTSTVRQMPTELLSFIEMSMEVIELFDDYAAPEPPVFCWQLKDKTQNSYNADVFSNTYTPVEEGTNLAYVTFTSGSTGLAKGVLGTHLPINHFIAWHITNFGLTLHDRFSMLSGLSHDPIIRDIFTPLSIGASLCIPPDDLISTGSVADWIAKQKITIAHITPAMAKVVINSISVPLNDLRWVFLGGDLLRYDLVQSLENTAPNATFVNFYGATETPQAIAFHVLAKSTNSLNTANKSTNSKTNAVPLGIGIEGVQLLVINPDGKQNGIGEVGEIAVRTPYLASGYLQDEALTKEKFTRNPATQCNDDYFYRTGDLGRFLPNGEVAYVGRRDNHIKIRGYRIELGEIESVLSDHPQVGACAVVAREQGNEEKILIAFVVNGSTNHLSYVMMRQWLAARLPHYMIPIRLVSVPALPLNPNGKLDYKALLRMEDDDRNVPVTNSDPTNLQELKLIQIWRRLFHREDISREDNFFDLGGHSLLVTQLATEIDKEFKCKIPVATIFQSSTIASLAQRITDEKWAPAWSSLVPIKTQGSKPPLFLVHGWGGDVFVFLELAKYLPEDQPIYGIQAVGLDGKTSRHISIEEMAKHYINEIISFQPTGPVYLGGYSMGGVIAFEVAQQLQQSGRKVAFLAILDSYPTGKTPWLFYCIAMGIYIPKRFYSHFQRWWQLPQRQRMEYFQGRLAALRHWINRNRKRQRINMPSNQGKDSNVSLPQGTDYYRAVANYYKLKPYYGTADIFLSDEYNFGWKLYWRYLARGGVTFHRICGGHKDIVLSTYHTVKTAKELTAALIRTQKPIKHQVRHRGLEH